MQSRFRKGTLWAAAALSGGMLLAGCGTTTSAPASGPAKTKSPTAEISIGTLYASTGSFATSSMPEYQGLQFWINQVNASGGTYVKAAGKKEKIRLVSYNDQSSAQTATSLYNQLITVNHVNMLVADFGSVLTSVAVPIAQEHKQLLFDQSGTGTTFFTPNNPYIVLTSLPTSALWPTSLANYLISQHYKNVAIVYCENDFDQSQDQTLTRLLAKAGITPTYNNAVPTSTSSYTVILHNMAATHPQAVIELGYPNNDISFMQALQASGSTFPTTFTIFPGQLPSLFEKNFGMKGLNNMFTYPAPPLFTVQGVNYGMSIAQFEQAFKKQTGSSPNFLNVAGYNTGLILQKTLATATSLSQKSMRQAVTGFSGSITTLDGKFQINNQGAQIGETLPVGQFTVSNGKLKVNFMS